MKNFSSRTRENSRLSSSVGRWWKPLLAVAGAFLALFLVKEALGMLASAVTTPFFFVKHYIETSSDTVPTFLRSQVELMAQIDELTAQQKAEEGKDSAYALMREENEELKSLFLGSTGTPEVLAGVIARPPHTPYDTLMLDRGEHDGVSAGAPVYYGKGLALGYVRETFPRTSLVTLFSSPGSEATVYVFGPDIFTTAYGEGGGVVRVAVPQGMTVAEGNLVVLPSLDATVLGVVRSVESVSTGPEQSAYVTLDVPLQSIRIVSVGTNPVPPRSFPEAFEAVETARATLFLIDVPEGTSPSETGVPPGETGEPAL